MRGRCSLDRGIAVWRRGNFRSCFLKGEEHGIEDIGIVINNHTAYLTDMGMTGAKDSVIGCDIEPVLKKFLTGLPNRFTVASENPACEGVLVEVDPYTGKALSIERIRETFGAASDQ